MDKSTFTPGVWHNDVYVPNIGSSISPLAPSASKVSYRSGFLGDPLVSLSNKDLDCLNAALSTGWYSPMRAAQFEGLSIWIRQSLTIENVTCLNSAVTSCIKPLTTEF